MTAREGGKLTFTITQGDTESVSATIVISNTDTLELTEVTEEFVEGVASFEVEGLAEGDYEYQIEENFETGDPLIYPDPDQCEDEDCDFPTITICNNLRSNETS